MYSTLHLCADMQRLQALAFVSKTEKNIVMVFVLDERKINNVILVTVWRKVFIRAKIKYPVHDRMMNTNFDFCLYRCHNIGKIQLRYLIISWRKNSLLYLQVRCAGQLEQAKIVPYITIPLPIPMTIFQYKLVRLGCSCGFLTVTVCIFK